MSWLFPGVCLTSTMRSSCFIQASYNSTLEGAVSPADSIIVCPSAAIQNAYSETFHDPYITHEEKERRLEVHRIEVVQELLPSALRSIYIHTSTS